MPEDRRLAAIMFTDIVGYTALMGSNEDKAFKILRKNREIQRPLIKKYRGEWLKEMGDGILASFHTASDAVRCAGEIQQAAKQEGIALRIGIHSGEVVFEGGDVLGDGVNVASRLEEFAKEGGINISGAVYKDIKNKAGIEAEFLEEKVLKNVDEPVKVYSVKYEEPKEEVLDEKPSKKNINKLLYYIIGGLTLIIIGILIWQYLPNEKTTMTGAMALTDKSIAVLPFRNDSPDPENEYFCNGMMETILNHLVKVGDLKVMSRTDVEPFRNTSKSRKEIASELGVANLLEGSVYRIGNRFRISIQLINPESGFHLWSNEYEGEYTEEVFSIQSNIAREVASALKAVITPEEEQSIESIPTTDVRAFDFMIRGQEEINKYWSTRDTKLLKLAHRLLDRALEFDPQYIDALAAKGSVYFAEYNYDSALLYAKRTIKINPEFSSGYFIAADTYRRKGEYDVAIENYLLAIKHYNQNTFVELSLIYFRIGYTYCMNKNDYIHGMPYLQKSIEKPDEVSYGIWVDLGRIFFSMGDYERAAKYFRKTLEAKDGECMGIGNINMILNLQAKFSQTIHFLDSICNLTLCEDFCSQAYMWTYLIQGKYEQIEKFLDLYSGIIGMPHRWDSVRLAFLYKKLGREQESNAIINRSRVILEDQLIQNNNWKLNLALSRIHAILEEKEESLMYLSEAVDHGLLNGWHDLLTIYPVYESLWNDPEFKVIVKRAQDEKAAIRAQVQEIIEREDFDL